MDWNEKQVIKGFAQTVSLCRYDEERNITIWFDPTTGWLQWILDFIFAPFLMRKPYKGMETRYWVNWGFFCGYDELKDQIANIVRGWMDDGYQIYVGGYSRGAAVAAFCAEDMVFRGWKLAACDCFGSPKMLTKKARKVWANIPGLSIIEHQNGNDIVTKIPPFYRLPVAEIRRTGPARRWWKLSIEDHKHYF